MIFRREKFARVPLKFYVVSWEFETSVQEFLHGRRFILTKIETGYVYLETWKLRCKKLCMDRPLNNDDNQRKTNPPIVRPSYQSMDALDTFHSYEIGRFSF